MADTEQIQRPDASTQDISEWTEEAARTFGIGLIDLAGFTEFVDRVQTESDNGAAVACGPDLYLAWASASGDAKALGTCVELYRAAVERALARMHVPHDWAADIAQSLQAKLFVSERGVSPYILNYRGRGSLQAWVRIIAVRMALKRFRQLNRRERQLNEDEAGRVADFAARDPELQTIQQTYREPVMQAIKVSVSRLRERDRKILGHHFVDSWSIDRLSEEYGVHRATAARWVARARSRLLDLVRRDLMDRLGVSQATCMSVMRAVRSQLNVSLSSLWKSPEA